MHAPLSLRIKERYMEKRDLDQSRRWLQTLLAFQCTAPSGSIKATTHRVLAWGSAGARGPIPWRKCG